MLHLHVVHDAMLFDPLPHMCATGRADTTKWLLPIQPPMHHTAASTELGGALDFRPSAMESGRPPSKVMATLASTKPLH